MSDNIELGLKKFDLSSIEDNATVLIVAKRGSGKSTLIKSMLYHKRHIPTGVVISYTEDVDPFFKKFVPPIMVYKDYETEIVENMYNRQRQMKKRIDRGENIDPRAFLVMDDCLHDAKWTHDKGIKNVFFNFRHCHCLYILASQYAYGIPPNLRTNVDYVIIMREPIQANRVRLWKAYAGMFETFPMFCKVLDQCTENYEFMVINNKTKSNKIEDMVFWGKADNIDKEFRCCSQAVWDYSDQYYVSDDEDEEPVDMMEYRRMTAKGPNVHVNKMDLPQGDTHAPH